MKSGGKQHNELHLASARKVEFRDRRLRAQAFTYSLKLLVSNAVQQKLRSPLSEAAHVLHVVAFLCLGMLLLKLLGDHAPTAMISYPILRGLIVVARQHM